MTPPGTPVVWGPCAACEGTGVDRRPTGGFSLFFGFLPCDACDGRGAVPGYAVKVTPLGWRFVAGPPAPTWEENKQAAIAREREAAERAGFRREPLYDQKAGEK